MINVTHLSKHFKLYKKPSDRLKELLFRKPYHSSHRVLNDINFTVADGEALAILGRNGAGKSTLLKILTGVLLPDSGEVHLSGKLTGLLELGTGFDPNLTGMQNIRTNGLLVGMTPEEIEAKRETIIEFSELGHYIDEPIRTYSSGMVMRLAFSIAIHADPDIFLIDEALSVGDGHFQQKCMRKIRQFRANGGSIVFVSHDLNAVKMLCDRAIVLDKGNVIANDEPEAAVNIYNQLLGGDEEEGPTQPSLPQNGYGSFDVAFEEVTVSGQDSDHHVVSSGEMINLHMDISAREQVESLTVGMMIRDRFGQDLFGTNSYHLGHEVSVNKGETKRYTFVIPMHLAPGKYTVTVALHEGMDHTRHCYHWWDNAATFEVAGIRGALFGGVCNLSPTLEEASAESARPARSA